jgi:hypothetical protein
MCSRDRSFSGGNATEFGLPPSFQGSLPHDPEVGLEFPLHCHRNHPVGDDRVDLDEQFEFCPGLSAIPGRLEFPHPAILLEIPAP